MTSKSAPPSTWAEDVLAETYRSDWGRLLSLLVARTRRLDLAEDALSEAFARAAARWPISAVPANPAGWLYTTASRLVIGRLRAEAIHGRKAQLLAVGTDWVQPPAMDELDDLADERLALVLLCCHPALDPEARSPLALRLVIGTSTEEIARLFLVPRATMAARITRAKKKIVTAGIPLSSPVDDELRIRLNDVCRTIYLAFTAGYAPGRGPDLLRADLAGEAIELAAILHRLVPDARQVQALYGLLLIQHARRDARVRNGRLVSLADQNRSLWHQDEIRKGVQLVTDLPADAGYAEELRLQGLIAAEHAKAVTAVDTNWRAIATMYSDLENLTGSPVVRLNRAVAVAESEGPRAGLAVLSQLDETLQGNHRFHAVRAELARRAGDISLARTSYTAALELCTNEVEQNYLTGQLDALDSPSA
ncbi:MAG: RNA polymerase sigma factor [Acidimicrobiales bacterium]